MRKVRILHVSLAISTAAVLLCPGLAQERAAFPFHARVYSLAFSPDAKLLAAAGQDQNVVLWDLAAGRPVRVLGRHPNVVKVLAFAKDGKTLVAACTALDERPPYSVVVVWNPDSGEEVKRVSLRGGGANWAISRDGLLLATVQGAPNKIIKVWDIFREKEVAAFEGDTTDVECAAFSADGKSLVTGGRDGSLRVWNLGTKKMRWGTTVYRGVQGVALSPDGNVVASKTDGPPYLAHLWDLRAKKVEGRQLTKGIGGMAFSPDGKVLAIGTLNYVGLWSVRSGQLVMRLTTEPEVGLEPVAFSPDGRRLAAGDRDSGRMVRIWDVPDLNP